VTVFSLLAKIASHLNLKSISLLKVDMKINEGDMQLFVLADVVSTLHSWPLNKQWATLLSFTCKML
jgi:hypothetical protein